MNVSERGIELIKQFESCELKAYRDPVGILTIGWGHTGPDVREGLEITQARADELLREDLYDVEKCLSKLLETEVTQNEYDALAALSFNIGCGRLRSSTLLRKLNAGESDCGPEFDRWVFAGGKKLEGLVRRRKAERELFES